MELVIILLIIGALYYALYKLSVSKNRNPWNWIALSLLISPIVLLVVLLFMSKLPKTNKKSKKSKRNR